MPPMVPFAMIRQISIEKFGNIDPWSLRPTEAHAQRFCIQPEAVCDYIWVIKLRNQIGIEAKRYRACAVASKDELVGFCQLVFMKVDYVFDNLAAMEIDCLSVNGMGVKPLMKIARTVTNNDHVEALLLKIISKHHPKVFASQLHRRFLYFPQVTPSIIITYAGALDGSLTSLCSGYGVKCQRDGAFPSATDTPSPSLAQ